MYGHTSVGWQAETYIHQLYADTECRVENLTKAMIDGVGESKESALPASLCDDDDDKFYQSSKCIES